jgi:hypothetical protein
MLCSEAEWTMSVADQTVRTYDVFLRRLHETHELPVYEAIERLVQSAAEIGWNAEALVRMLDEGISFEQLLEAIECKLERSGGAA